MRRQLTRFKDPPGRHHPFRALGLLAVLSLIASPRLWAQNGKTQTNTAQATLRLTVRVVPVAMLPPLQWAKSDAAASVTYSLPSAPPRMTVTEEIRPLSPGIGSIHNLQGRPEDAAILKTLTVVAR